METISLEQLEEGARPKGLCCLERLPPRRGAKRVVVFVHGLGGNRTTWGKFPVLLYGDPELQPAPGGAGGCDIVLLNHRSASSRLHQWVDERIPHLQLPRAVTFEQKVEAAADGLKAVVRSGGYQDLTLVGHSLGGIMLLAAVRSLLEKGGEEADRTLEATSALVFLGTPFGGSDRLPGDVSLVAGDLGMLESGDGYLEELVAWMYGRFTGNLFRLRASAARFKLVYSARDRWVRRTSAEGGSPRGLAQELSATHTELCKPADRNDQCYTILKEILREPKELIARSRNERLSKTSEFIRFRRGDDPRLDEAQVIYESRFPDDERVPFEFLRAALDRDASAGDTQLLFYGLSRRKRLSAIMTLELHQPTRLAWLGYVASRQRASRNAGPEIVDRRAPRNAGLELIDLVLEDLRRRMREGTCKGIFFEVEQPNAVNTEAGGPRGRYERRARIRLFGQYHPYWIEGVAYRQPQLEPPGGDPEDEVPMFLGFLPLPESSRLENLARTEIEEILTAARDSQIAGCPPGTEGVEAYGRYLLDWKQRLLQGLPMWVPVAPIADPKVQARMQTPEVTGELPQPVWSPRVVPAA